MTDSKLFSHKCILFAGVISYTNFLAATLEARCDINKDMVADAFDKIDVEGTGAIDKADVAKLLPEDTEWKKDGEDPAETILQEVNVDDGKLDFQAFANLFDGDKGEE